MYKPQFMLSVPDLKISLTRNFLITIILIKENTLSISGNKSIPKRNTARLTVPDIQLILSFLLS